MQENTFLRKVGLKRVDTCSFLRKCVVEAAVKDVGGGRNWKLTGLCIMKGALDTRKRGLT